MTLAECIQIHETSRRQEPAPVPTPKGIALVALYQMRRAMLDMEPAERAELGHRLCELAAAAMVRE